MSMIKKIRLFLHAIFLTVCIGFLNQYSFAQGFHYELTGTPVDITGWDIGGDAIVDGDAIRLTEAVNNQVGYIYYSEPQDLTGECSYFNVEFEYRMNNAAGLLTPADGLAFWFLETPPSGFVLGGGMGMPSIMKGFALAFDVYNNDAIADNPIVTLDTYDFTPYTEGFFGNSVGAPLLNQTYVNDGTWRHCRLEYNTGIINVYIDHNPLPSITGPLDLDGIVGYFGFSAATGGSNQQHYIRNVFITGSDTPDPPTVEDTIYICQTAGTYTFEVEDALPGSTLYWYVDDVTTDFSLTAPTIDTDLPGTYIYYVSQSAAGCPIESERVPITVIVKELVSVEILTSATQMCTGGSVTLEGIITADEDYVFTWIPTAFLSDPTSLTPTATPPVSSTYQLVAHTGLETCADTASILITVIPNDITLANEDDTVCAGTVVPLNTSGHPVLNYIWAPGDMGIDNPTAQNTFLVASHSGMIYITASHPGCEDRTDSFYLKVEPQPSLDLGPDVLLCMSDTAHLYASVEPSDFDDYTYRWTPGVKLSDSTIKNPIFRGYSSEEYIVFVETPNGCFDTDTIQVIVNASKFLQLDFTDTNICITDTVQLQASGGVKYTWTPSVGLTNDTISNPYAYMGSSMIYKVVAENEFGCIDTGSVTLNYLPGTVIDMPDSVSIYPGESYEIQMVSNGHYFNWFPPEGLSDINVANPIASPEVRTRYFVRAYSEFGCSALDSIDIIVNLESLFDVPNAFVPGNSFANNGEFKIEKRGDVELLNFQIYNRWGVLVFETKDINKGWDGTYNNSPQPMGVYVYVVEGRLSSGRIIRLKGDVTLIR